VIAAVVRAVAGRPVSAALGELPAVPPPLPPGCAFLKWGLAGRAGTAWREALGEMDRRAQEQAPGAEVVRVAYADAPHAGSPAVEEVCDFACRRAGGVFLLDTYQKAPDGPGSPRPTLLTYLSVRRVLELCRRCRAAGARVALAGSLGAREIELLLPAEPDWFGVRGAACANGDRRAAVDELRVRDLVAQIGGVRAATPGS
jgi:uncharacterized protein (UPF0264 family)